MTMKVGLFIPCYINAVYPQVGIASYKLLKSLGVDVDYPLNQTCCGQPMANAGFENKAVLKLSATKTTIVLRLPAWKTSIPWVSTPEKVSL